MRRYLLLLCAVWPACFPFGAAAAEPLRFDLIPGELTGPDGRYQPLRTRLIIPDMPRDELICFCLYTAHRGVLKVNTQLYPLEDGEERAVQLHVERAGGWQQVAEAEVNPVGWSALFRVENWDDTETVRYRVTHAGGSQYEGTIRRNPTDKDEIVAGNLSCNSNTDRNLKPDMIANLQALDPDLLFFAGDQSYDHRDHLAAWLQFGRQFGEIIKDRPTVTIPDDHDVGHPNLWGAGGTVSKLQGNADGGYVMPVEYVNMVQRQQTAHLPDPYDPTPIRRGITVYYTSLNVGGIDFAVIEDRKWKTGPAGLIPPLGPRPDHINDPDYDRQSVDVPEAELLGERQLEFLRAWGQDWTGTEMKCVLSQTTLAGAAHLHGRNQDRLLADLDSNGWPQSGRNAALREIRKGFAFMMCGDQHLATVIHHGINDWGDAGWQFTSPSIWNLYGRAWVPLEKSPRPFPGSPLEHAGDFYDGFGNKLTMAAYANPTQENYQATGYGIVRFRKSTREIAMECWPRFVDVTKPGATQYAGWPLTIRQEDNYGRKAIAWLPRLEISGAEGPVVQVIDEHNGEVVYTLRIKGRTFSPKVFREGMYTVRVGEGDGRQEFRGVATTADKDEATLTVEF
ncbi:MAG TPA: metallophosphoesterase family protein [Planctomycetaceae bacterium]|nr:metallophosphoesterase family protein [Planctomycetaceae bacterium]